MTDTDILKKNEDIEIGTDKQRDILSKRKRETNDDKSNKEKEHDIERILKERGKGKG